MNLWEPIDLSNWRDTPSTVGRVATDADVRAGRAVFYLQNADQIGARPIALPLPCPAMLRDKRTGKEIPVIVIQAEEADGKKYIGYRRLNGGNGISTLGELEFLDEPDARFER